jgi:hypothetical protein
MADWHTLPGWTTAHRLEQYGSLGAIRLWITTCGREYRTPDPELDDTPVPAPADMRRCQPCLRVEEQHTEGVNP